MLEKLRDSVLLIILLIVLTLTGCAADWEVFGDTWTATDALGRKLPGYAECGPQRKDKFVGIFYFIWLGPHGKDGPFDITKIVTEDPTNPKWGPLNLFHHWSESELGYYLSNDAYVIRKHSRMLVDAGVDTLIFDVTNAFTYDENYLLICKVFDRIRKEGGKTPQICFITNSYSDQTVERLYKDFYSRNLYPDLWFRWQGKPLILAAQGNLSQEIKDFFTFRQSWAWHDPKGWFGDGKDKWPWLDSTPQAAGWHVPGVPEEMCVCVAQHPTTNIGRSHQNRKQPDPSNFKSDQGIYFAEQWKHALETDPQFIFITGWNEWVAQRFVSDGNNRMLGKKLPKGDTFFVDTYSQEYSRDIEPMMGGHTDNYYYQMIDGIRRFKGVSKPDTPTPARTIKIDGDFAEWDNVRPEFRDHIGDTEHRDSEGWGNAGRYVNNTGRNDFVRSKVTYDARNVYFYIQADEDITPYTDPNWMLLFIDSDCDSSTGWHGYDLLVNKSVVDKDTTTVCRATDGWKWNQIAQISYAVKGNCMEIAVPRSLLGNANKANISFDFHWADNIQKEDDIIEFAVNGDSAPDRRFNYRFSNYPAVYKPIK